MKIARSLIAKILSLICSILGIPLLFSCDDDSALFKTETEEPCLYGMPPNWGYVSGVVKGDSNGDGTAKPLANVNVYVDSGNEYIPAADENGLVYKTSEDGRFYVDLYESCDYVFRFEDGDGKENGLFKSAIKTISWKNDEQLTNQDIELELDNSSD